MFSFLGKPQREIRNCKKLRSGWATFRLRVLVTLLAIYANVSVALPLAPGMMPTKKVVQHKADSASGPTLRRFSLGEVLYLRHCADCHGWEGRGDGPLAAILAAKPRDLRQQKELFAKNSDAQIIARILYGIPLTTVSSAAPPYSEGESTALITYLRQLPTTNWEEVGRGKDVYDSLCAACHGLYGRGDGLAAHSLPVRSPDLTSPAYQQISTDALIRSITNGKGAMPGAGDVLTAHEIKAVVSFLRILSPGYELYMRFCAHCHGFDGQPPPASAEEILSTARQKSPPPFDISYFRVHTTEQIRRGIQHMRREPRPVMPHLARQLTAEETSEIVRYLRTLTSSP